MIRDRAITEVYFARTALQSKAMMFPMIFVVALVPFLGSLSSAISRHYSDLELAGLATAGLLLLGLAVASVINAMELFSPRRSPAIIFQQSEMFFRRIGRKAMTELRYADIEQFYIQEIEGRGSVTRILHIYKKDKQQINIYCDTLDIEYKELQNILIRNTPDISYQSDRT